MRVTAGAGAPPEIGLVLSAAAGSAGRHVHRADHGDSNRSDRAAGNQGNPGAVCHGSAADCQAEPDERGLLDFGVALSFPTQSVGVTKGEPARRREQIRELAFTL